MLIPPPPQIPEPPDGADAGAAGSRDGGEGLTDNSAAPAGGPGAARGPGAAGVRAGEADRPPWYDPDRHNPPEPVVVSLPEGLVDTPAGPELGRLLDQTALAQIRGYDTVEFTKAAYRQACHARAVFLLGVLETGIREPGSADTVHRVAYPGEFAPEEARAALGWSRRRTEATYNLAYDVYHRLPLLGEAMLAGTLDEPRAAAFTQWTAGLTDDQAIDICSRLLPTAAETTLGALIDEIKRLAIAIDPTWAERRYRERLRHRRITATSTPDGTAAITGHDLPIDRAAAATGRIDELAYACKRAGDRRPIDHIRTDVYLGMLDGTFETMTDAQVVTHIRNHPTTDADDCAGDGPGEGPIGDGGPDSDDDGAPGGGDGDGDDGAPGSGDSPGRHDGIEEPDFDTLSPADVGGASTNDHPGGDHRGGDGPGSSGPSSSCSSATGSGSTSAGSDNAGSRRSSAAPPARPWSARELRVELTTLLGLDDHPADLPGWGYIPAPLARQMVNNMMSAEWRWVICDQLGHPIDAGITSARPDGPNARTLRDTRRGGIVELQLNDAQLVRFGTDAGRQGCWAPVITDIARQQGTRASNRSGDQDGVRSPAGPVCDLRRRVPGARLRRWLQIRDRQCTHPTCRMPARRADQDHRDVYARGGETTDINLGSRCRHDHRLRHEGGWTVTQPIPRTTVWTSPLGHSYVSRPPPILVKLPEPSERIDDDQAWLPRDAEAPDADVCGCTSSCHCGTLLPPPRPRPRDPAPEIRRQGPESPLSFEDDAPPF